MDSPFASFSFTTYVVFALVGEIAIGMPYALGLRALLLRIGRWSSASMWVAALLPGIAVTLFEANFEEKPAFGPCLLIAAAIMAGGWWLIGFDSERHTNRRNADPRR